ncbi:protein-glutamate methylesterase/protein-glutamine glutaminase [Silvibacterium dinghuense]|uniref:Protein-glutamate methylesterase/protein-glutamine glutaminase n=1 Tax=Silvibacterium dinghuense TaxID=1560006 RepID=A0A4Q1SD42_9BACT|nr:chemotaxis response regulator protein-glutamate methylesterase [Silvibacterium dinghuense]RXS95136.1 chemotaxis response regulator protein-glutamate methylesterase [Silvibacterium dinghuense]GGH10947.1 chemotaxis response regulator protein-glutamate methylesterase of group 2 operon [Silvibacterium dinghuense]
MPPPYKVLIVDDSALMRQILTQILSSDPDIEVIGVASDPYVAREKIKALHPDVLTLDVEMPRMDGLTFLEKLMRGHPMPVVMISTLTEKGADVTLRALSLGAIDYVAKPKLDVSAGTLQQSEEIITRVKAAARARVRIRQTPAPLPVSLTAKSTPQFTATHKVVAIGASTGGTEALREVLTVLPADFPGIVIVQHMPEAYTQQFAARLNSLCRIRVKEAEDRDRILPGHALIAPGGHHMAVIRKGMEYGVHVYRGERVNRHLPSVDVLFSSCARELGRNVLGVMLTGMGGDGARGMLEMKQSGAFNMAQDEATSVVFGMPNEAIKLGGVDEVLPLERIPLALLQRLSSDKE